MSTPRQFLESFLQEKATVYADANVRLLPIYTRYFGGPLSQRTCDFMLRDRADAAVEDVTDSGVTATAVTSEHFRTGDVRTRYHLAADGKSWRIVRIDRECFLCRGTGQLDASRCRKCDGEGWYDPRNEMAEPGAAPNGGPATPLGNSGVTEGPPSVS